MRNMGATLLLAIAMLFTACEEEEILNSESEAALLEGDYMVFGSAASECAGPDCAKLFLLQGNRLYADDMPYFSDNLIFSNQALSSDKYNLSVKLITKFPRYLKKHPNKTFGCPDCRDQGLFYIEIKKNNKITRWHIDTTKEEQPTEIRNYMQTLRSVINEL